MKDNFFQKTKIASVQELVKQIQALSIPCLYPYLLFLELTQHIF